MSDSQIIVVCGLPGSNSEQAGKTYAAQTNQQYELRYAPNGIEVIKAMQANDVGVIPIWNSTTGLVNEAKAIPGNARLITTLTLPVHHQLIAQPDVVIEDIKRVVSHEQALAQCKQFLDAELPDVEQLPYADTAQAAKDLADGKLLIGDAVVASPAAAGQYGLEILRPNIEDSAENRTTFSVFALSGPSRQA